MHSVHNPYLRDGVGASACGRESRSARAWRVADGPMPRVGCTMRRLHNEEQTGTGHAADGARTIDRHDAETGARVDRGVAHTAVCSAVCGAKIENSS